ncbi:MAG: agmatine deiminase family protein [Myxococcota bacterium]
MTRPGVRWPAEWEPHAATWLAWPHNAETWPGHLAQAHREYVEIVRALQGRELVRLLVRDDAMEGSARRTLRERGVDPDAGLQFLHVPTNDAWVRDWGPIFVAHDAPRLFDFDAWGGKYPPWDLDAAAGARALGALGRPSVSPGFVLEGGSVDGNGAGCLLTTESCLLNPNREPGRTREGMEERLARWLGAERVVWLEAGISGDDTDGHVDDVARFATRTTVVAVRAEPDHADHAVLAANLARLRAARSADGRPLDVVELPVPPQHRRAGLCCPASYANFYLANGVALVPTFDAPSDARALAALREIWPDREVTGIPCQTLVLGLGAVHCLSQQEPLLDTPAALASDPSTG